MATMPAGHLQRRHRLAHGPVRAGLRLLPGAQQPHHAVDRPHAPQRRGGRHAGHRQADRPDDRGDADRDPVPRERPRRGQRAGARRGFRRPRIRGQFLPAGGSAVVGIQGDGHMGRAWIVALAMLVLARPAVAAVEAPGARSPSAPLCAGSMIFGRAGDYEDSWRRLFRARPGARRPMQAHRRPEVGAARRPRPGHLQRPEFFMLRPVEGAGARPSFFTTSTTEAASPFSARWTASPPPTTIPPTPGTPATAS